MFLSLVSLVAGLSAPETTDTIQPVTVVADRGVVVSRVDTAIVSNAIDVTEIMEQIPGLQISDGGGMAGLKTVNLRGMGASSTAIYLDGVRVGNLQSGQTDLGMLDMCNLASATVDYAQNSVSFTTARPVFAPGSRFAGKAGFTGGSFATFEPYGRFDLKLSPGVCMSASASGVISRGDFPYGDGLRRDNNDIRQIRTGLDFWGLVGGGDWHAKVYYNGAQRGAPGSVDWPCEDRQKDRNVLAQGLLRKGFSRLYSLSLSAKASYDDMFYSSSWSDDRYRQTEFQLNSSHKFSVSRWCDLSAAVDIQWDDLVSTACDASRFSLTAVSSAAFRPGRFSADVAVEYFGAFDRGGKVRNCISPSLDIGFSVTESLGITAFGRRAYRVPTFNELYYVGFGNPDLKPEDAWLTGVGLDWKYSPSGAWSVSAKADGFYNYLKDKIVSAPTPEDPAVWQPYNVGIARSIGADLQAGFGFASGRWSAGFNARYSFQDATDRTPDSYTYGQRIAYIARNTVCLSADGAFGGWSLKVVWNFRGGRYDSYGAMPDWNTLDITAGKDFSLGKGMALGLKLLSRNLTDCRYDLSSGYPMPGRAFYGAIEYRF